MSSTRDILYEAAGTKFMVVMFETFYTSLQMRVFMPTRIL